MYLSDIDDVHTAKASYAYSELADPIGACYTCRLQAEIGCIVGTSRIEVSCVRGACKCAIYRSPSIPYPLY